MEMFTVFAVFAALVLAAAIWLLRRSPQVADGPLRGVATPAGAYDVVIVGAGPGGATTACYLEGRSVALLERKTFPRPKPCGDAWCPPALDILEELGVLQEIEATGLLRECRRGGFVSPFGYECVGGPFGKKSNVRTCSIKRHIADEFLAKKAAQRGAQLFEQADVAAAEFDKAAGLWTVSCKDGRTFRGRVLVIADGSTSYLAQKLGIVHGQAEAVCTHQYIDGATLVDSQGRHPFDADGIMYYNKSLLPGYSALFKHYNDDIYVGTYILPGGLATSRVLPAFEKNLVGEYPPVADKLPEDYEWRDGRTTAPIRIGGVPKSYAQHCLIVGDAAGQVDPMTGEGIHTAMIAGKIAARTIHEMFEHGDFSERSCSVYHARWKREFGHDFVASALGARLIVRFPILLDAVCVVGQGYGQQFLDDFGMIMCGAWPKWTFYKYALPVSVELVRQVFIQHVLRREPLFKDPGFPIIEDYARRAAAKPVKSS
eukprot:TRINITY_DN2319_c0_g2_i1.p1 TRINITY_DN2319_c0_g2~~TRINITY_DN2319_c0_g2_i1.p1  ORF type:complete len:503 (+),score=159.03 TRINITY_DN2319_c0_g2_i1:54-1511(+)